MTPTLSTESGPASPVMGASMAQDRDGIAVLNDQGAVVFTGCWLDAVDYMAAYDYQPHCNCEVVENRDYQVGFEPF